MGSKKSQVDYEIRIVRKGKYQWEGRKPFLQIVSGRAW